MRGDGDGEVVVRELEAGPQRGGADSSPVGVVVWSRDKHTEKKAKEGSVSTLLVSWE